MTAPDRGDDDEEEEVVVKGFQLDDQLRESTRNRVG